MTRSEMLNRCEQLARGGFANDAARAAFDELITKIEAIDRAGGVTDAPPVIVPRQLDPVPPAPMPEAVAATPAPARRSEPSTLTGRPRLLMEAIDELERTGAFPEGGIIVAGSSYTAAGLRRLLESRPPSGYLEQMQAGLNAAEDADWSRRQREAADAERDRRLARFRTVLSDDEDRERRELLDEAREAARPPDPQTRTLALLERIATALEGRS